MDLHWSECRVEKVGDDAAQGKESEEGAVSPAGRVGEQKGSRRRGESAGTAFLQFPTGGTE